MSKPSERVRIDRALVKLRMAALEWVAAAHGPVFDSHDSVFKRKDRQLKRAAINFAKEIFVD